MENVKHGKKNSYTIYFATTEEADKFKTNGGFEILDAEDKQIRISLSGKVNGLIQALSQYDVIDIQSEKGNLEELFMPYYGG